MRRFILFLLLVLTLLASPYDQGKKLYFSKGCNGCHGVNAKGLAQYPSLAYRPKPFLTYKLERFRKKIGDTQQSQLMIPFAQQLTNKEINTLTTFLSTYHEEESRGKNENTVQGDGGS